jgi:hypothetical protein
MIDRTLYPPARSRAGFTAEQLDIAEEIYETGTDCHLVVPFDALSDENVRSILGSPAAAAAEQWAALDELTPTEEAEAELNRLSALARPEEDGSLLAEVVQPALKMTAAELLETIRSIASEVFNTLGNNMWDLKAVEAKQVEIVQWLITSADFAISPTMADLIVRYGRRFHAKD